MSIKSAIKQIESELLQFYRYYFDGNRTTPDGIDIRVAICAAEKELKEFQDWKAYYEGTYK